jgi:deferrochelatase/peroxidase EfeB
MFAYNDVEGAPARQKLSDAARNDLQCNILHSTGHLRSKQLFVRFETRDMLKAWLKTTPEVTSASAAQAVATNVNLLFTRAGLKKLAGTANVRGMDPAFQRGAQDPETLKKLEERAVTGPHGREWDAALLIHSDGDVAVSIPSGTGVSAELELGNSLDAKGEPIDPANPGSGARFNVYGYRDGVSVIRYEDGAQDPAYANYDPRRELSTLLAPDPLSDQGVRFGSYFVFRKYKQDVEKFEAKVAEAVRAITARKGDRLRVELAHRYPAFRNVSDAELPALVRAWIMGRHPDGTPLAGEPSIGQSGPDERALNDFTLVADAAGEVCPFHAHASKMNPRGRTGNVANERRRSLARRGISFGCRSRSPAGILFWCAQASIIDQFEYVQRVWANDRPAELNDIPHPDLDNLIGKERADEKFETPTTTYPVGTRRYERWKSTIDVDFGIYDTITLEGSEYFYAPSLSGIAALKRA